MAAAAYLCEIQINDGKAICLLYIVVKKGGGWLMMSFALGQQYMMYMIESFCFDIRSFYLEKLET